MACWNSPNHLLVLLFLLLLTKSFNSNAKNFNLGCIHKEREALLQHGLKQGLKFLLGALVLIAANGKNNFGGIPIPEFTGLLKNLRYLNLSFVSFTGVVPSDLGNLSNLRYLSLIRVNLSKATSWLQLVNMLPMLRELYLSGCELRNLQYSLPFINLTSLSVLDLSENNFNPPIPHWLFNISTLTTIQLSGCGFSGSIPRVRQENLCNLRNLDLTNNGISGEITEFVEALSGCNNRTLRFSVNKLGGYLPVSLWQFKYLEQLGLALNSFIGALPASVGNLSHLESLSLGFNEIDGTIPETVGQLTELNELYLSGNPWKGVVTENHLQNLTRLVILHLSSTSKSLVFNVRRDWIAPFRLSFISISDCQLGLAFPSWLRTQRYVDTLILSKVAISDEIPDWFWRSLSPCLDLLDLSNNQLRGKLPRSINLQHARYIDLRSNHLEGSIPLWKNVTSLSLRNNSFSGPIPLNIGHEMSGLEKLDLSRNLITGSISASMREMRYLMFLDLSHNYLSGEIPSPRKIKGRLRANRLTGNIPQQLCLFPYLHILDLAEANPYLCGPPLTTNCSSGLGDTKDKPEEVEEDEDGSEKFWLLVSVALGFIVGFWAVCGTLIIKRSWRHAYFRLVDETKDKLHVFIAVHMARLRRKVSSQMLEDTNVHQREVRLLIFYFNFAFFSL
ncbi:hypothetical protein Ddye_031556 [Dipteronia dyeriana]|uniref:Disease resistance R13L4/SHOC-2-like LRR domain-containing protein n=1 Tax=Dipteronia dyeriana TaxID=168575 RepID=A0AAD9WMF5_9ROSI|nr:hypothetical protein Ddye_031556 [Dipteronia dyeriana]